MSFKMKEHTYISHFIDSEATSLHFMLVQQKYHLAEAQVVTERGGA